MKLLTSLVNLHKNNNTYVQFRLLVAVSVFGLTCLFLIFQSFTSEKDGADAPECRMSYMAPAYARIKGFDSSHTKFASKYSLYLYREQGKDPNPVGTGIDFLTGIPVLFIPGNAGSYKQVRALASESANMYLNEFEGKAGKKNLDFFTADFNEDFTAFHGRTLLDQSEYLNEAIKFILTLYAHNGKPPTSVMVIAHSMGGIVARTMITLPNYLENSINTFITLATPHSAPPITFDGDIMRLYAKIDEFWKSGFSSANSSLLQASTLWESSSSQKKKAKIAQIAKQRLRDVSLISLTGGMSDTVLPADYTTVKDLVPLDHGFTAFSTGIPGVWTPIDHLAIVWCDQFRKVVSKALLEIVNGAETVSLHERMQIFRKMFLSGFEKEVAQIEFPQTFKLKVDNDQINSAVPGERSIITPPNLFKRTNQRRINPKMNFFYIPKDVPTEKYVFNALSSLPFDKIDDFGKSTKPIALLCSENPTTVDLDSYIPTVDFTSDTTNKQIELICRDSFLNTHVVPRSAKSTVSASESSIGGKFQPYTVLQFNSTILSDYDMIIIGESPNFYSLENSDDFLVAELIKEESSLFKLNTNFFKLLTFGSEIKLPKSRALSVTIEIPAIYSSLVAYTMKVVRRFEKDFNKELERFGPLIKQSITSTDNFETKWLMGSNNEPKKLITMHGLAPFITSSEDLESSHLVLQLWSDSLSVKNDIKLNFRVNIFSTLGLLVMRYRLLVGTMPIFIIVMVLYNQFTAYNNTGTFKSFGDGLLYMTSPRYFATVCVALSATVYLVNIAFVQNLLYLLDPIGIQKAGDRTLLFENTKRHSFFLGLQQSNLFLIAPLFYCVCFALVTVVYFLCTLMGDTSAQLFMFLSRCFRSSSNDAVQKAGKNSEHAQFKALKLVNAPAQNSKRRILGALVIFGSIPFYVPYQLSYFFLVLVQGYICIKKFVKVRRVLEVSKSNSTVDKSSYKQHLINIKNYNLSFFMLVLWIMPINFPVILVFVRNFALSRSIVFSSHHNFLAIVPILIIIERNAVDKMPPRCYNQLYKGITKAIIGFMALYTLLFGVKNAWWLHHLLNIFCAWLVILNLELYNSPVSATSPTAALAAVVKSGSTTPRVSEDKFKDDDFLELNSKVY